MNLKEKLIHLLIENDKEKIHFTFMRYFVFFLYTKYSNDINFLSSKIRIILASRVVKLLTKFHLPYLQCSSLLIRIKNTTIFTHFKNLKYDKQFVELVIKKSLTKSKVTARKKYKSRFVHIHVFISANSPRRKSI